MKKKEAGGVVPSDLQEQGSLFGRHAMSKAHDREPRLAATRALALPPKNHLVTA